MSARIDERNEIMASRSSKNRKMRQDRMMKAGMAAGAFLLVLIITVSAFAGKNNKKADKADETPAVSSTVKTSKLEFEIKFVRSSDIHKGSLVLVNDSHVFPGLSEEESLTVVDELKNEYYSVKSIGMKMDSLALKSFNNLMSGFYQQCSNNDIMITSAFISENSQNLIYNQALENSRSESRGGYSEHQTGLAVDLGIFPDDSKSYRYVPSGDYAWIKENCTRYGFIQRYADDKSDKTGVKNHTEHFRYVGIPHAWYMKENNLSLEEYLQEIKKYSYGSKTLSVSCYEKDYEIYYIKAKENESDSADIYVPVNQQYTVSGNNVDGFIITVEK